MASGYLPVPEYIALPHDEEAWIIDPLIPAGGLCNLYGAPKLGKSTLALQMGAAIASGQETWMGFPIPRSGPVVYIQLDTPRSLWRERLATFASGTLPGIESLHVADSEIAPEDFDILNDERGYRQWLRDQTSALDPVLTIIDTLREFHRGDENDSAVMTKVMSELRLSTHPSALLLLSHSRKESQLTSMALMESARGSSYVAGRMDTVMRLSKHALTYQGRTCEETRLIMRLNVETHLWEIETEGEADLYLTHILHDANFPTQLAKAKELSRLTKRSIQACRRQIQKELRRLAAEPAAG